jgi:hypothetical protein
MRTIAAVICLVLLCPAAVALAQSDGGAATGSPSRTGAPPSASGNEVMPESRRGSEKGMTRDQYVDRAKNRAARRFERLDANHDGVLSPDERRAGRHKTRRQDERMER